MADIVYGATILWDEDRDTLLRHYEALSLLLSDPKMKLIDDTLNKMSIPDAAEGQPDFKKELPQGSPFLCTGRMNLPCSISGIILHKSALKMLFALRDSRSLPLPYPCNT